jgi:hypothetical protein
MSIQNRAAESDSPDQGFIFQLDADCMEFGAGGQSYAMSDIYMTSSLCLLYSD